MDVCSLFYKGHHQWKIFSYQNIFRSTDERNQLYTHSACMYMRSRQKLYNVVRVYIKPKTRK